MQKNFVFDHFNNLRLESGLDVDTQDLAVQVEVINDSLQQQQGSLDCRVLVCEIMARKFSNISASRSCDTIGLRTAMVYEFLNTPGRSYTNEGYEALKVARSFMFTNDWKYSCCVFWELDITYIFVTSSWQTCYKWYFLCV